MVPPGIGLEPIFTVNGAVSKILVFIEFEQAGALKVIVAYTINFRAYGKRR
jgi:hypothetical protein